jgi:hypothetical protein
MIYAPKREPRQVQPSGTEPIPPRSKPRTWLNKAIQQLLAYRQK